MNTTVKNLTNVIFAAIIVGGGMATANAADQGHGTITFAGSIIDAPCSITPESIDQTVNLGQISNKALAKGGKSNLRAFDIKLESCDITGLKEKTITTTFTGTGSTALPGYLAIVGTASGASIGITADDGKNINLGEASPVTTIQNGSNTLRFAAYLQGNGGDTKVVPGEFTSVANFTLAYQ